MGLDLVYFILVEGQMEVWDIELNSFVLNKKAGCVQANFLINC